VNDENSLSTLDDAAVYFTSDKNSSRTLSDASIDFYEQ
jgi:hypothetical protein